MIELGHRKIALLGYFGSVSDSTGLRFYGAKESMEKHGIAFDEQLYEECDFTLPSSYAAMSRLLKRREDFTAVFASSDIIAIGATKALSDRGYTVPGDVSVVGFDGTEQADYCIPSLATMRQPSEQMAHMSVELLLEGMQGKEGRHVLLPPKWIESESIRKL